MAKRTDSKIQPEKPKRRSPRQGDSPPPKMNEEFGNREELGSISAPFAFPLRVCAALLLAILLLQPFGSVFAAEEEVASTSPETTEPAMAFAESLAGDPVGVESTILPVDDGPSAVSAEDSASAGGEEDVGVATTSELASEDMSQTLSDAATTTESEGDAAGVATTTPDVGTGEAVVDSTLPEDTPLEDVPQGGGEVSTTTATNGADTPAAVVDTDEQEVVPPPAPSHEASTTSTTTDVTVTPYERAVEINDQTTYRFSTSECVSVQDGFFYCTKQKALMVSGKDRFFAAQDQDGDFEIFFEKDSETTQVTHNQNDDSAPYYDAESNTLVWHALIADRYQIVRYDLSKNEMTQLTNDPFNNMEPVISGERIVWQAWVGDDWEVMLDDAGERTQLTNNDFYDIDPHVRGDLISWQTHDGEKWHVEVFDIKTGHIEIMEAGDGASVENPRFVLLYDSTKANGDTETMGYDLKDKKVIALGVAPTSLPKEIPEPEHEKETRALVQTAPNVKEETSTDGGNGSSTPSGAEPPLPDLAVATSTATEGVGASVLDATSTVSGDSTSFVGDATTTIPTLDLRPEAELNPLVAHIPDVVITPLPETASSSEGAVQ